MIRNIDSVSTRHVFAIPLHDKHHKQKILKTEISNAKTAQAFYLSLWSEELPGKVCIQFLALHDTAIFVD